MYHTCIDEFRTTRAGGGAAVKDGYIKSNAALLPLLFGGWIMYTCAMDGEYEAFSSIRLSATALYLVSQARSIPQKLVWLVRQPCTKRVVSVPLSWLQPVRLTLSQSKQTTEVTDL